MPNCRSSGGERLVAVVVIVVCLIIVLAAVGAGLLRARRESAAWREMALSASRGDGAAVERLGTALATRPARSVLSAFPSLRPQLNHHTAPALARGVGHRSPAVAAACAEALGELGASGLRAAWGYWTTSGDGPGRSRTRAFLLQNPDWLFTRLLEAFAETPEGSPVPHADLWREGGLADNLAGVVASGDPELASLADRLGRALAGRAG